ncbi:MAG: phenylalanine--tRNA ligase subunit beta [Labilithrix sp.]|nr:phenylalanine--tRNA ligase subunit beta [Labilithrix sp.]MCW5811752.1 phenylalanine--tRNA ligase subunit beta [Labilithrix sp.]
MKASYRWLRELLPSLTLSADEVARALTSGGLEVEGKHEYGAGAEACLVVKVVAIKPHPTKSGLRLVTVEREGGKRQEVVCGAPNVPDPGGLVVLAPLGAHLPAKDLTIAPRAIAGVTSEGMLCSESELGLSDESGGILVLPPGTAEPGTPLATAVPNARDTVLEIGLTPNRPDGLGHVGLARELAAHLGTTFQWPAIPAPARVADEATASIVAIEVEDAERCPHYGAAGAVGVSIAPSPLWARYRLQALGVRSISNVVDVTNLVMLEYGHPMHAFDLDRVRGKKIVVRRAKDGETMKTLDDVERKLVADDLLICDGEGPVALAGVMGGASSEIHRDTKRVLFECAWFDPRTVRRTARRHGMHTESSHRFERGVDPSDVAQVLDRAVALTLELSPGAAATKGRLHVQGSRALGEPSPVAKRVIHFDAARVAALTGVDVPFAESVAILKRLGCEMTNATDRECDVHVPTHRPDIGRGADLVEEVIRMHGIDKVPAELPPIHASRDVGGREDLARRAKEVAAAVGLSEAITFSFTSPKVLAALGAPPPAVTLTNPMAEPHSVLRTTLLAGLLDAIKNARRHGERDVRVFTVGPVYLAPSREGEMPEERLRLAFALAGDRPAWLEKRQALDVWDAKGYAIEIARRLSGKPADVVQAKRDEAPAHLHPRGAGFVVAGGERIGSVGPLHPDVIESLDLDGEVLVLEIELEPFRGGAATPRFTEIPRFPASARDIALVVKDGIPAGEVEAGIRAAAGPLAIAVRLFDRFAGGQVPAGHTSLAFRVVYRDPKGTLTDAQVDAAHAAVVKEAEARFGATLRAG